MSAVAYTSGITKGVDGEAAGMAAVALEVYMRDLITALVTSRPQSGAASVEAGSSSKAASLIQGKAKKAAKKKTIASRHLSTLLTMKPSLLHSSHLSSVERFTSHEALRSAPSRSQRIKRLEKAQIEKAEAKTVAVPTITIKEDEELIGEKEAPAESTQPAEPAAGDKSDAMDLTSTDAPAAAAAEETLPKPKVEDDTAADGDVLAQLMAIDNSALGTTSTSPAPPVSLEAELFPELPPASIAAPDPTSPAGSSEKDKDKDKDKSENENENEAEAARKKAEKEKTENKIKAFHELGDVPSSEDEDESFTMHAARKGQDGVSPQKGKDHAEKASKDKKKRKKNKQEKNETGRLGLWKILTDILEGGGLHVKST